RMRARCAGIHGRRLTRPTIVRERLLSMRRPTCPGVVQHSEGQYQRSSLLRCSGSVTAEGSRTGWPSLLLAERQRSARAAEPVGDVDVERTVTVANLLVERTE